MKPRTRLMLCFSGAGLLTLLTAVLLWGQNYSHARIVRLSYVEGTVTVQRPDVAEWAEAPVNTPLQEGFRLSTAESSFAEVEFENASTVRLGQFALLEFTQLVLTPGGGKVNRMELKQGYATFHAIPERDDVFEISTPNGTVTPRGKALFRVDLDTGLERVEVFKGSVDLASSLGSRTLARNAVLELRPGADSPYNLSEGITEDSWDKWVEERDGRVELSRTGPGPSLYSNCMTGFYGWNDLSTYGMWSYLPGYGYGWMPTMVGADWVPYGIGRWSWYPGFGYTWIGGEPWGWLPYHYGEWAFVPATGWSWFPGDCGFWSPALVTWYAGPGWIGWAPRTGSVGGGPCTPAQRCGTVVKVHVLQHGLPINPAGALRQDLHGGVRVERPDIPPSRAAMFTGSIVSQPPALGGARPAPEPPLKVRQTYSSEPGGRASGAPSASGSPASGAAVGIPARARVAAPESGIVFDPVQGRYVNSHTVSSGSTAPGPVEFGPSVGIGSRTGTAGTVQSTAEGSRAPGARGAAGTSPVAVPAGPHAPSTPGGRPPAAPQSPRSGAAPSEHRQGSSFHHSGSSSRSDSSGSGRSGGGSGGGGSRSSGGSSASTGGGMSSGGHSGGSVGGGHAGGSSSSGSRH